MSLLRSVLLVALAALPLLGAGRPRRGAYRTKYREGNCNIERKLDDDGTGAIWPRSAARSPES